MKLLYIDLFCGAGGTSTGVENARLNGDHCAKVIACVNHDKNAIASHAANHPDALHFVEDIRTLELSKLIKHLERARSEYPDAKVVLWASLECTNFSKAKGGLPRDADSRTLAYDLYRYIETLKPDYVQIENVEEFMAWGDVDKKGRPISMDRGKCYQEWVFHIEKYGYDYDFRILNAANYGAYTSRKRYFGIFAKEGLPIEFPEPTHAKNPENAGLFPSMLKKWRAVREVLDFSKEGRSIFDRKKNLVEATLDRILSGLIKFVAGGKNAWEERYESYKRGEIVKLVNPENDKISFLSKYFSGSTYDKNIPIDGPAGSITTKDHHAFISAYYGNGFNQSIDEPSPVVTTKDRLSLISPSFIISYNYKDAPRGIESPCPTLLTKDRLALTTVEYIMSNYSGGGQHSDIDNPSPAITGVPKQNLVRCYFIDQQFGKSKAADTDMPLGALTANPKYNLVECDRWVMNTNFNNVGSSVDDPSPTITANRKWHYLMDAQYSRVGRGVDQPCFTLIARMDKTPPYLVEVDTETKSKPSFVKTFEGGVIYEIYEDDSEKTKEIKEFMALYGIIDIKMRMLLISELKRIMGFPKGYKLFGTQAEQKKYIGNAVEVNMARVLCEALAVKLNELNKKAA